MVRILPAITSLLGVANNMAVAKFLSKMNSSSEDGKGISSINVKTPQMHDIYVYMQLGVVELWNFS